MPTQELIFDSIDELHQSETDRDLWSTLYSVLKMCNVSTMVYHHLPPPGAMDFDENFVLKKTLLAHEGFAGEDKDLEELVHLYFVANIRKGAGSLSDTISWALSSSYETGSPDISGFTFPAHGPGGRNGCFSLILNNAASEGGQSELRVIEWACQKAHQKFCAMRLSKIQNMPTLTGREIEILTWVARGKSNGVIAQILGISHHTVNTYMRRIFLKMGISDRTTVALAGLNNGLIDL